MLIAPTPIRIIKTGDKIFLIDIPWNYKQHPKQQTKHRLISTIEAKRGKTNKIHCERYRQNKISNRKH